MNYYTPGKRIGIAFSIVDNDGDVADADSLQVIIRNPDNTLDAPVILPTPGQFVTTVDGYLFVYDTTNKPNGVYGYRIEAIGDGQEAYEGEFHINKSDISPIKRYVSVEFDATTSLQLEVV